MTTNSIPPIVEYLEDGVTRTHTVPFKFDTILALRVQRVIDGVAATLALGIDYEVFGVGNPAGGSITKISGGFNGSVVRIDRVTPRIQSMSYTANDTFPAKSHEAALDRAMFIDQEQDAALADVGARAIQVPIGETAPAFPNIASRRNRLLAFTMAGAIAASFPVEDVQRAILNATAALAGQGVAEGVLYQQEGATTIPRSSQSKMRETYSILDYRYVIDSNWGVTIQRAIDAATARGGGVVEIPASEYLLPAVFTPDGRGLCCLILKPGVTLRGVSKTKSILKMMDRQIGPGTYLRGIVSFGLTDNCGLLNFTYDGNRDGQGLFKEQGNGGNIVLGYVRNCTIEHVVSINGNGQLIQVASPLPFVSENVSVTKCRVAFASGSTVNEDGSIAQLYNGNGIGIQLSQFRGATIKLNYIEDCRDNGIDTFSDDGSVNPVGGNILIEGNHIRRCRVGIFPETTANCQITNNYIVDCVEGGIFANRINGAPAALSIDHNKIGNVPVGVRVTGDCNPQCGVRVWHNMIYSLSSTQGYGVQLGLPGANVSYVDVSYNMFGAGANIIPLIGVLGNQAAFITGVDNHYFGTPDPGYLLYKNITSSEFRVDVASFIGVSDRSRPDFERKWGSVTKLQAGSSFGLGVEPVARQALTAIATDAASTMALANSLRSLAVKFGLGA